MSVYLDAIKTLEELGWNQGSAEGPDGSVCIDEALGRVCMVLPRDSRARGFAHAFETCKTLLNRRTPLYEFNDDPSTTYEDVVLLLKQAHEASEAAA